MQAVREPQGHHLLVQQKLKDHFSPVYLTLLSVIQGVALADLAFVVGTNSQHFTLTQWLLVLVAFGAVITTWNQYTMHIISLDWIPDVRDAIIPFVLGALELFLNHLIPLSFGGWLFAAALLSSWGALATWHTQSRAGKEVENQPLLNRVGRRLRLLRLSLFAISPFLLLLAVASTLGHVQATQELDTTGGVLALAIALFVVAITSGLFLVTIWYWQAVVTYARTGHMPGKQAEEPGT